MRASAAAAGLPTEEIETKVALIQALIPLGLEAVDAEATRWPAPSTAGRVDAAACPLGTATRLGLPRGSEAAHPGPSSP